ncbi:MAG: dTDP-4-dehydrorhamnose reductase, partial [Candidatus Levybacteria bacterium RIFCSPLOWO2_01_FULL_40_64]
DKGKISQFVKRIKPDVVINASAFHVVRDCEEFPDKAFIINSIAIKNLAQICQDNGSRLIHYSTDYVFDGRKGEPYLEDDAANPLQLYGISKLAGEYCAKTYCSKSLIIRTAYLYGGLSGSRSKGGNFVLTILKQAKENDELEVASDQIVSPTYAKDLAIASLRLILKKPNSGIYHLVNEGYCSLAEFSMEIIRASNKNTKVIPIRRSEGDLRRPMFSALKNTSAAKLGVTLPSWKDALKRYLFTLS